MFCVLTEFYRALFFNKNSTNNLLLNFKFLISYMYNYLTHPKSWISIQHNHASLEKILQSAPSVKTLLLQRSRVYHSQRYHIIKEIRLLVSSTGFWVQWANNWLLSASDTFDSNECKNSKSFSLFLPPSPEL